MKVAVLGGTFNPIHNGHLALAQTALNTFALDKIIFVPAYFPPHKADEDIADANDRFAMVKLAIEGNDKFEASRLEINRRDTSYSIDTIAYLKKIYPKNSELFFLIGSDLANTLEGWKDIDKILSLCRFIVGVRPGYAMVTSAVGGSASGGKYKNIEIMPMEPVDTSSNQIRQKIKENKPVQGLVPYKVAEYIERFKIYKT